MHRPIRRAFTLVELLVVITIIGLLMALLIPAVNVALQTARTSQCLNNMRQLGLGMQSHATTKNAFPGYRNAVQLPANVASALGNNVPMNNGQLSVSWAGQILGDVDRQDTLDAIKDGRIFNAPIPVIEVFLCPTDVKPTVGYAGLSYVVNTGTWDNVNPSGANQVIDAAANGVCHNLDPFVHPNFHVQVGLGQIRDGAGSTLLLSENIHKASQEFSWTWGTEQQLGMVWVMNNQPQPGSDALNDQERINQETEPVPQFWGRDIPRYARPAANHNSGVNVIYCDGHGQFLREDIDYTVYQRLLTPHGTRCVDPTNASEPPSNNMILGFRSLPPLSDAELK